jgi:hypothetical protein
LSGQDEQDIYMRDATVIAPKERRFPFKTNRQKKEVDSALRLFKVLWHAHELREGPLSTKDMQNVFHDCISDALSYADGGWRRGKFWSQNAWKVASDTKEHGHLGLKCEHVIPRVCVLKHAMEVLTRYEDAEQFVIANSFVCVVTSEENDRLNKAGFSKTHPAIDDPWLRYAKAQRPIQVLDVPEFLSKIDQDALTRHGLLFPPTDDFEFA